MRLKTAVLSARPVGRLVLGPLTQRGYRRYRHTGETSPRSYAAMRKLFAADPAAFERVAAEAQYEHPPLTNLDASRGVAGGEVDGVVERLRRDGVAVLSTRLPPSMCAELEFAALTSQCTLTGSVSSASTRTCFAPDDPVAVRYDLDEADIVDCAAAQTLLADESLLALAQQYLGAPPVQDMVAMWWSAAIGADPSPAAAQMFHFDLDRLRFLKVFVYVTDVDHNCGPHAYVKGSHRGLPPAFRHDRRYRDDEVAAAFDGSVVTIDGPAGTVFVADTRGLHKGLPVRRGHRLVFQMEYTTSLFGQAVQRLRLDSPRPELAAIVRRYPYTFQRFTLTGS